MVKPPAAGLGSDCLNHSLKKCVPGQWPRQTPACAGWEFVKRRREPARPGRGSVWAGDLARERAESPSHTDPDSLRDPCLIFLLQDRRKAPLGFSDQCPSVVHSVRLVRNCIQAFHPPS